MLSSLEWGLCSDGTGSNSTTWEAIHATEQGFAVGMLVALIFTSIPGIKA